MVLETVEGGGLIILLLCSLTSLTNLYTMDSEGISESERELKDLKEQPSDACPGNAVAIFLDAILDKALRTVALRAARRRGKSAALCYCCSVIAGYLNIFVIALNPENLKTLFEFVCKGLDALDYKVKYLSIPMGGKDRQMIGRDRGKPGFSWEGQTSTCTLR
ncbi:hypothetical protein ACLB2K_035340 [Fragaria x ananassa]